MTDHRTIEWAVEIISMCEPIRCVQGGMWFGRNHNCADATFVDYGAADAFAVAARELPRLVELVRIARETAIEECAKFVEQHQERITETANGSERSVSPRMVGNQMGLAYVAGIRSLVGIAGDGGK
jgi:hypothetical protein